MIPTDIPSRSALEAVSGRLKSEAIESGDEHAKAVGDFLESLITEPVTDGPLKKFSFELTNEAGTGDARWESYTTKDYSMDALIARLKVEMSPGFRISRITELKR